MKTHGIVLVALFAVAPTLVRAQWHGPDVPDSLSFQGYVTDSLGVAYDTTLDLTFRLYKGASEIWTQTQSGVAVSNGVFSVILGGTGAASLDTVAFSEPIDLGITIAGNELTPRTPLTGATYALGMRGMYAIDAVNGDNHSPNLVGGAPNNFVGAGVVGATIGGGGGQVGGIVFPLILPDSVVGSWGTVGGGLGNKAGLIATVAGGRTNRAEGSGASIAGGWANRSSATQATVGGGFSNSAGGDYSTVSGGSGNSATLDRSTVSGGSDNDADGGHSTISGGQGNSSTSFYSTVGGGVNNSSGGQATTVAGGAGNSVDGDYSTVAGGAGNVVSGEYAAIPGGYNNVAMYGFSFAAGQRAAAKHAGSFVWADSATSVGSGGVEFASTDVNQFLIRAGGGVGIGTNDPANQFHVARSVSAAASVQNHVALIDNTSTGSSADVLALRVGNTSAPGASSSFITFVHNTNTALGFIRGTGTGGIELSSLGADYAEYLPHLDPGETFSAGEVVGIYGGHISHRTANADQVMVVSTSPLVVGNNSGAVEGAETGSSKIAFIGQAPVLVTGPVARGDFLIPSGAGDGRAVAVPPERITPDQLKYVFATAWASSEDAATSSVNAAIGVDQGAAAGRAIVELHERQNHLEREIERLAEEVASLTSRLTN